MPKKYLVSLRRPDRRVKGMNIGGKFHRFSESGHSFIMSDSGAAKEMSREYGRGGGKADINISEIPGYRGRDDAGHRYVFGTFGKKRCSEDGCVRLAYLGDFCPKHAAELAEGAK